MQPKNNFKKTLLASAFVLGVGGALNAGAETFVVTASAVPDVSAVMDPDFNELSFGSAIKGAAVGEFCKMNGSTGIADDDMLFDMDGGNDNDVAANPGLLTGNACYHDEPGTPVIIEIDGADGSTVSVTIPTLIGAGFTYIPSDESCVVDYDRTNGAGSDSCVDFNGVNTITNVGMSLTKPVGVASGTVEDSGGVFEWGATSGKTRMVIGGQITIDSEILPGTIVSENLIVQVTYE